MLRVIAKQERNLFVIYFARCFRFGRPINTGLFGSYIEREQGIKRKLINVWTSVFLLTGCIKGLSCSLATNNASVQNIYDLTHKAYHI